MLAYEGIATRHTIHHTQEDIIFNASPTKAGRSATGYNRPKDLSMHLLSIVDVEQTLPLNDRRLSASSARNSVSGLISRRS